MLNTKSARQELIVSRFGFTPLFVYYPCWTHTWKYNFKTGAFDRTNPETEARAWTPGRPYAVRGPKGPMPAFTRGVFKKHGALPRHWIYVFAFDANRGKASYFAEIYSKTRSRQLVNPASTRAFRLQWTPDMEDTHPFPELPVESNGLGWHYACVGVPYRLSDACLDQLEEELAPLIDWEDSATAKSPTAKDDQGNTIPLDAPKEFELPVLYPLHALKKSAHNLLRARSLHAISLGSPSEVTHGARRGGDYDAAISARESLPKQAFLQGLLQFLEHPNVGDSLRDRLRDDGMDQIESDLEDITFDQERHHIAAECYARDIAGWMLRKLFRILIDGYERTEGPWDVRPRLLIEPIEAAAKALSTCALGTDFLASMRGPLWKDSIIGALASRPTPSTKERFDLAAKYGKGALAVFSTVHAAHTFHYDTQTLEAIDQLEGYMVDLYPAWKTDSSIRNELIKSFRPRPSSNGRFKPADVHLRLLRIEKSRLDAFAKGIGDAQVALEALDALNLALAVVESQKQAGGERWSDLKAGLDVSFATADLLATVLSRAASETGKRWLAGVGMVCALYSSKTDVDDLYERWHSGDADAAAAKTAMVIGAAGSLISGAAALTGAAALGPIGAVAVAIGVIGAGIYQWVKDTKFEELVEHCAYGRKAGNPYSKRQPKWSGTPLSVLSASWTRQLEALMGLQGQFSIGIETDEKHRLSDGRTLDVHHARLRANSYDVWTRFIVQWTTSQGTKETIFDHDELKAALQVDEEVSPNPFLRLDVPDDLVDGPFGTVELRVARLVRLPGSRSSVFGKTRDGLALPHQGPLLLPLSGALATVNSKKTSTDA